ncbi:MAG: bifunctional metallophosphatase/5'-nucleotidase [Nitrospirae bacterium]|nr:bifunctional metallophosphatase/5'-nucleotidase [Nitrospirota bacterium]
MDLVSLTRKHSIAFFILLALIPSGAANSYGAFPENDTATHRTAEQRIYWRDSHATQAANYHSYQHVKILAINDFHGHLSSGRIVGQRHAGGAAVLASYLKSAERGIEDSTLIVLAGDHVGASPPVSALLKDEPAIMFMNILANKHCTHSDIMDPDCNIAATVGNHEFDKGVPEMRRLIFGGNHADGPFLETPWHGAVYPYVVSNVTDSKTGRLILPPYVIKKVHGIPIAFIGAVLKDTPNIVTAFATEGLSFLDEADSINKYARELRAMHVKSVIALIHQGGRQKAYSGATMRGEAVTGPIADIVSRLDDGVDVVISGHSHAFTNAFLHNRHGKKVLVTQAFSYGTAFADIDLDIDRSTWKIVGKSAAIITTYADAGPGLAPDPEVSMLAASAESKLAPLINQVIGHASTDISGDQNSAGESALGNLIADAQRAALPADFAFTNPGGIRDRVHAGDVTWGTLYAVQPFNNYLVRINMTGRQIYDLLNQQWQANLPHPRMLQISGLTYTWDSTLPSGKRIVEVRRNNAPISPASVYTVVVNSFLAGGGDSFKALTHGTNATGGTSDLDALIAYIRKLPQPFSAKTEGRITKGR